MPRESGRGLPADPELDEMRRAVEQREAQLQFGRDKSRGGRPRGAASEAARFYRSHGLRYPEDWLVSGEGILAKFNQKTRKKVTLTQLRQRLYEDRKATDGLLSPKPARKRETKTPPKSAKPRSVKKTRKSQTV
jgi:hypothetical protein